MKNSQLSLHTDESGTEYLQYVGDVSKSNNGGLAHLRIKNKVVRAYENVEKPERCPVKLYKKYISHVPLETSDNSFYYINTSEIPSELSRENFISSHVKITCYLHM